MVISALKLEMFIALILYIKATHKAPQPVEVPSPPTPCQPCDSAATELLSMYPVPYFVIFHLPLVKR
ncbi:hypothetical protein XELAEV_18044782mg [Xenopus laevis]|uniref:Secreted protein n=1 Tax=Xenopus laevis TaxID=8355 RepID=A0A974BZF5_XENLA|nr:hypothetical protein XELAEV_18044782mg [Xenopus laevis]